MLIDKRPYDDRSVNVNAQPRRLYVGGVVGGSTALYGAALMRPSPEDFHPGRYYGRHIPRSIWDWPLTYDVLEPHYATAEQFYGVAGSADDNFGPIPTPRQGFARLSLPVKPIHRKLMAANAARGLKPFRLPLAIDFDRCLQCSACPGYICPTGARQSAADLLDQAARAGSRLELRTNIEVERFCRDGRGQVAGVRLRDRTTGQTSEVHARRYALAAGAIGSPLLLLRSGPMFLTQVGAYNGSMHSLHLLWSPDCSCATSSSTWSTDA
jgi:choline dehydrogenase-like flavoprotein